MALVDAALARGLQAGRARQVQLAQARALARDPERADSAAAVFRELLAGSGGEGAIDAEAFAAFLSHAERTPKRVDDYRWLFGHRLQRASDAAGVLVEWAHAEETLFDSPEAAQKLYRQVLERDPERTDALSELARLQVASGDAKGALESLDSLVTRVEPEAKSAVELRRAALMIGSLSRAREALALVEPILALNPSDAEALRVVHQALSVPESRAGAAAILERVAEGSEDPSARADVIEALLAVSNDAPELAAARSRWLTQLLETKTDVPEEALRLALRGAEAAPGEQQLWEFAEQMARRLDQPGPVAEAYTRAIERELAAEVADSLGRRVVEFHEEWFDDPEQVVHLLERVTALCPAAEWAFDRLKLSFNAAGRWSDLFALYDRRLAEPLGKAERVEILREAAMAARDFASDPERAIAYFEKLNALSPGDARVESSLERLYERHGHRRPLIELLNSRLSANKSSDPGETMGRIAALWLDLNEPLPALAWAEKNARPRSGRARGRGPAGAHRRSTRLGGGVARERPVVTRERSASAGGSLPQDQQHDRRRAHARGPGGERAARRAPRVARRSGHAQLGCALESSERLRNPAHARRLGAGARVTPSALCRARGSRGRARTASRDLGQRGRSGVRARAARRVAVGGSGRIPRRAKEFGARDRALSARARAGLGGADHGAARRA